MFANATKVENFAGMIATVVLNDTIIWAKGYGKANFTDPSSPPPNIDHLLRVASITKVWTSMLAYALRDQGRVSMDDDVRKYLPGFQFINPYTSKRPMTLRQLAAHTSGIRRDLPYQCQDGSCDQDKIFEVLKTQVLVVEPNTKFHYSNVGFDLLGQAMASFLGVPYSDAMQSVLLGPLNVSATLNYDAAALKRMAVGRSQGGKPAVVKPSGWDAPCGDLLASARDISKLMSFFFSNSNSPLDRATAIEMLNPATVMRDGSSGVATPFELKFERGVWMSGKQGEEPGYRSSMTMVPDLKLGVFTSVLEDDTSEQSVWTIPALDLLVPPLVQYLWAHQPVQPLPTNYQLLLGTYSDNVTISVSKSSPPVLLLALQGTVFNLTQVLAQGSPVPSVLRAKDTSEPQPACRWLQDGADEELVYFSFASQGQPASSFEFAGGQWTRK